MSHLAELAARVPRLAETRVLCVGDLMLDRYVYGEVERISPEAPIPVLRVTHEREMLGGVGNVVRNLCALGATAEVLGAVGDDPAGARIREHLNAAVTCRPHLWTEAGRTTTLKTRCVGGGQQVVRIDRERVAALQEASAQALLAHAREAMAHSGVLILSDYGKGLLSEALTAALVAVARERGVRVVVDPKGRDYRRYRGAAVITPNRRELAEASGLPAQGDEGVVAAARQVIDACGVEAVLATRSAEGMTLVERSGGVHHVPAAAREVFDVSGAGDTVVATLAAALEAGAPLLEAARLANAAAGVVVGKQGTAVVDADELGTALRHQDVLDLEARVVGLHEAQRTLAAWREQGLVVGFTNGCFDLLHPGHVTLLARARAACDRLVVGLNSDASVRRLKGEGRPVQAEAARATVLASLASVDRVVVFEEDTPLELIEALRPDLLVKGADYTLDQVVGADLVQGYAGRVLLVDLVAQQSTTALVRRMAGAPSETED